MSTAKSIFVSKTFWVNALTAVGTLAANYGGLLPPPALPYVVAATGIVNIALRLITKQPVTLTGSGSELK